ncbi:MAG: hypothetical protein JWQ21_1062 [Herminiimonas sp.]|nr:hypothetical protein [Herminiimonas sp.]
MLNYTAEKNGRIIYRYKNPAMGIYWINAGQPGKNRFVPNGFRSP